MFTIEKVNELLGKRSHWTATPYATLDEARESARAHAKGRRSYVVFNILDARGNVLESLRGSQ